ncbi:MAG: DNRLRE domain-containing protein, partial [Planctomycetales bacterium]|nr:DNRLRE domain-containing protein [Planctomycetales bacterium]
ENVRPGPGTGNILIKNGDDNSLIEGINVNSDQVTFDGATVTIDPTADLDSFANYYVEVDPSAIRDMSSDVTEGAVLLDEDFERLQMLDSPLAGDGIFDPNAQLDNHVVTFTGTMVVNEAGEYTFGGNSDDGQWLLIDLDQDSGGDLEELRTDFDDEIIIDNTTHGNQDRLSTCGVDEAVTSCVGTGSRTFTLDVGEYLFEWGYFEAGGGTSGEFFYAKGTLEAFDASAFVLMGDDSQGIGITEEGMTATNYKSATAIATVLYDAWDLRDGFIGLDPNFNGGEPAVEIMEFADVWNEGGFGNFNVNNTVPGAPVLPPAENTDYSPDSPFGWTNDLGDTPPIAQPEYSGWVPLDKNWWINQQGNQDRFDWTMGEGTVAVIDPDAYDDFGVDIDADGGLLNAVFTTPEIDLTDVAENSVNLSFLSSFRSEPTQIARLEVSFDGGANFTQLLEYDGAVEVDKDHIDENLSFDLSNPSGGTMIVRFSMLQASNDWWWAIDNVVVTGDVTGGTFAGIQDSETWNFNTFTGEIVFVTQTELTANESDGSVVVTVKRLGGDPNNPISVDYATSNGTAKAGDDYEAASGTLDFAAGETEKSVVITLIDDDVEERGETFSLTLSNATGDASVDAGVATVTLRASDGDVLVFQEGAEITLNGDGTGQTYAGTTDADPAGSAPDDIRDSANINPDGEDGGQPVHALTKFDNIFGENAIPEGVEIARATLTFNVTNEGTPIEVSRMLAAWDETITWNGLKLNGNEIPGVQPDGVEATEVQTSFSPLPAGVYTVDVTGDVAAWLAGEENHGWAFTPTGTNGVDWDSSEAADVAVRPKLTVEFVDVEEVTLIDGDINGDNVVDLLDFNILKANFGGTDAARGDGDLNADTVIDLVDFNILKENFGNSAAAIAFAALADDGEEGLRVHLERNLTILASIGSNAPFIGLFGTV